MGETGRQFHKIPDLRYTWKIRDTHNKGSEGLLQWNLHAAED